MCTLVERWGKRLAALITVIALTACTLGREPAYDAAIAGEVTGLTADTLRLFQEFTPGGSATAADREPRYRAIAARAQTVRLMAQARGSASPAGGIAQRVAVFGAKLSIVDAVSPQAADRLAEYSDATPAYMVDFLRNLALLEAHDHAATGALGVKFSIYEAALKSHQRETEAYLEVFCLWQAGAGQRPVQPSQPPAAPLNGLDPIQIALRTTALEDILRDALIYERDILNRNR